MSLTHYVRACEALERNPNLKAREVAAEIGVPPIKICKLFYRNGLKFADVRREIAAKQGAKTS